MPENNIPKQTRGLTLREPKDIRRVVQRITSQTFQENKELELADRIAHLVKSYAEKILEKLTDHELDRVGAVVEKIESGGVPTSDEYAFLDELESK